MKKNTFLTLLTLFIVSSVFSQQTIFVSAAGAGSMDGTSEANAYDSFTTALADVNSAGDIIRVIGDINVSGVSLNGKTDQFTIEGDAAGSTLTGTDGAVRMFTINSGTGHNITFKNLIFTGATNSTGAGGGVLFCNRPSTLTFENCVFNGNSVAHLAGGGAILINNVTSFTATGTTFYQNAVKSLTTNGQGGAIVINGTSTATITNCSFYQNTITRTDRNFGAAIRVNGTATCTVSNSLFNDNKANDGAGNVSGLNGLGGATINLTNSIADYTNNLDSSTDSTILADLTNSTLSFDATLNKVIYTAANALTDDTPVDFGSDNSDVGAWDSKINIFEGTDSGAWITATNWSNGSVPTATDNVAILTGKESTLAGEATVNDIKVTSTLKISNNRVLIVNGTSTVTGLVRYFRTLTNNAAVTSGWHLVSSPLSGEVFDVAYADKNDIATNGGNRGIATYNPGSTGAAAWTYFTGADITTSPGQGYSMKITPDAVTAGEFTDNLVAFEGDFNTDNAGVTTSTLTVGFNLIGNPYASFVNSATFLGAATSTNIDQTQIWLWNQATGMYETKVSGAGFVLAPTQGFFVNATSPGTVNFVESNQATTGGAFQKTSRTEIKLLMNDGTNNRFAKIYLTDTASKGFDYGWEGETFGGIPNSVDVFTHLVEDNQGKNYQVQSLPVSEIGSMVIPVGVIAEAGKELTFSLEQTNFPTDVKVYLEDRVANTYNELTNSKTFKVTLSEALNDVGRFYLHASKSSLSVDDNVVSENISMYKSNATTLKVVGLPNGTSNIKLFNILGKQVLNTSFTANGVKEITLPKLAIGVYIVQLETETSKLNKKIVIE